MELISIEKLKKKYPDSYSDLLLRLGIRAYNSKYLKLNGIRFVEVFTTDCKQYYRYHTDLEAAPFSSPDGWDKQGPGFRDSYILTIASSGNFGKARRGDPDNYREERLEYAVYIQDRKAEYGMYSGDLVRQSKELIELFIAALSKLINIDVISVVVFKEDRRFMAALRSAGFEKSGSEQQCYKLTKIIQQSQAALPAAAHLVNHKL